MNIFLDFTPSVLCKKLGAVEDEDLYTVLQNLVESGSVLYIDNSKGQITDAEMKVLKEKQIPVKLVTKYPFFGNAEVYISDDTFVKGIKENGIDYSIQNPFKTYNELKETVIKNNIL